jgi:hypothetical protein
MSLIRVRRERKKEWIDVRKGLPLRFLIFLLVLVVLALWLLPRWVTSVLS